MNPRNEDHGVGYIAHDLFSAKVGLRSALATALAPEGMTSQLDAWRGEALEQVRASIDLLQALLAQVGDRQGPRADAARAALSAKLNPLVASLAMYEGIGSEYSGPFAIELMGKIAAIRADSARAEETILHAAPEAIIDALNDREKLYARARILAREFEAIRPVLKCPSLKRLPKADEFDRPRRDTLDLASRPAKRPSVLDQHRALDQGRAASPEEARMWILWEPTEPHALCELRWARYQVALEPSTAQAAE